MKTCNQCGAKRPVEDFPTNKGMPDGRLKQCRDCVAATKKAYRISNADALRAKRAARYAANREGEVAKQREKYQRFRVRYLAQQKVYRLENLAACHRRSRDHYRDNREYRIAYQREYRRSEKGRQVETVAHQKERVLHAEKIKARYAVSNAVRAGRLVKSDRCGDCGKVGRVEAHHHAGYAPENRLVVHWLCRRCHKVADGTAVT